MAALALVLGKGWDRIAAKKDATRQIDREIVKIGLEADQKHEDSSMQAALQIFATMTSTTDAKIEAVRLDYNSEMRMLSMQLEAVKLKSERRYQIQERRHERSINRLLVKHTAEKEELKKDMEEKHAKEMTGLQTRFDKQIQELREDIVENQASIVSMREENGVTNDLPQSQ